MTDRALPPPPDQWVGRDTEREYLLERWPDGHLTLAVRSLGSHPGRWSAPVAMRSVAHLGGGSE